MANFSAHVIQSAGCPYEKLEHGSVSCQVQLMAVPYISYKIYLCNSKELHRI